MDAPRKSALAAPPDAPRSEADPRSAHGTAHGRDLDPFYFGPPARPLFGCYHPPKGVNARDCVVVLCYPAWREYMRAHRSCRQTANRLSQAGYPVLRFDYSGSGDSAGESEQGNVDQWLDEISTAISEAQRRSGRSRVSLMGLRFGATLSALAGVQRHDLHSMVMWDPVVSGAAYIQEMTNIHERLLGQPGEHLDTENLGEPVTGILGIPFTASTLTALRRLNLLTIRDAPANNILVIDSVDSAPCRLLAEHLQTTGAHSEYLHIAGPRVWMDDVGALVPGRTVEALVSWLVRVSP